jgi:hypothetical protein
MYTCDKLIGQQKKLIFVQFLTTRAVDTIAPALIYVGKGGPAKRVTLRRRGVVEHAHLHPWTK